VARALQKALAAHDLAVPTFFAQNDGTLMALEYALRYPALTIGSGPANSMRGAAWLSGVWDALVADVGGTSTDIGTLVNDFPREASGGVELSGVQTNFRMPDLMTIPLGGGSVIEEDGGRMKVGPRSVGYRLTRRALSFGGGTPTLTDAAPLAPPSRRSAARSTGSSSSAGETTGPSWRKPAAWLTSGRWRSTSPGYLLRQDRPRPSRRLHRPRLLTVSGPRRLDAETPRLDRFSHPRRPSRTRRRKMRPIRSLLQLKVVRMAEAFPQSGPE
jgi:Hydantoinase/oxoprolinase